MPCSFSRSPLHVSRKGGGGGGAEKAIRERFASKPGLLFLIRLDLDDCIGTETFQEAHWVKGILPL